MKSLIAILILLAAAAPAGAQVGTYLISTALALPSGPPTNWTYQSIKFPDVNGDGYPDLCYNQPDGIYCALFSTSPGKFGTPMLWLPGYLFDLLVTYINYDLNIDFDYNPAIVLTNSWTQFVQSIQYGDVDGDGKADLCLAYGNLEVWCALSIGTRFLQPWLFARFSYSLVVNNYQFVNLPSPPISFDNSYWMTFRLVDLNHDGKMDVCMRTSLGLACSVSQGRMVTTLEGLRPCAYSTYGDTFGKDICPTMPVAMGDINTAVWDYALSPSDNFSPGVFSDNTGYNADPSYWSTLQYADLNGDGLPDVCGRARGGMRCLINWGTQFVASNFATPSQFSDSGGWQDPQYYSTIHLADINGDGKADICGRGTLGFYCGLSNGSGFDGQEYSIGTTAFSNATGWNMPDYYLDIWLVDANGDGAADICGRGWGGIWCAISGTRGAGPVQFTSYLWVNNFGNNFSWGSSPAFWQTVQPVMLPRPGQPRTAFCGRGTAGIWCTQIGPSGSL